MSGDEALRTDRHVSRNWKIALALAFAYCALFIPPNLTGADDANMLAPVEIDEFTMHRIVMRMLTLGDSLTETLRHWLGTGVYHYGYPFFLSSALFALPIKALHEIGAISGDPTQAYLVVLRQLSPLWMAAAIVLLIHLWTGFRSTVLLIGAFLFLAFVPGILKNNLWWHPDSLATLFVVAGLCSLAKDHHRFGRWYYAAAILCGLATGTKLVGLYFVLPLAVYVGWAAIGRVMPWPKVAKHLGLFLALWLISYVLTNPQLLVPRMAEYILWSFFQAGKEGSFAAAQPEVWPPLIWYDLLNDPFGFWWMYVLALGACGMGLLFDPKTRLLNALILAWTCSYGFVLIFLVTRRQPYYAILLFLPLFSCLMNPVLWSRDKWPQRVKLPCLLGSSLAILLCCVQFAAYLKTDVHVYRRTLNREDAQASLGFFRALETNYLATLPPSTSLVVFRDPYVYVPPRTNFVIHWKHGQLTYDEVETLKPDLILLQRDYVERYCQPEAIQQRLEEHKPLAERIYHLYSDAQQDTMKGFRKVFETEFAVAFAKNG